MKTISLAIFAILVLSISAQTPLPHTDYNSANALLTYLLSHHEYYLPAPNSLFFQFAWYITAPEVDAILKRMDSIYNKYGLNGVFLVLDQNAGIGDINSYSAEIISGLDYNWELFHTENVYLVILQYVYVQNAWQSGWALNFAISCGDTADAYLPHSSRQQIMDTYGPVLKYYTNENMMRLMDDIEYAMEQNAGSFHWYYIPIILCILLCCGGGGYYGKRRYDNRSGGSGIHVTSAQY